jgi:hypothetical protein
MADDPVDKFLTEQKTLEAHRHELIKEVLRQKEAAIKVPSTRSWPSSATTASTPRSAAITRTTPTRKRRDNLLRSLYATPKLPRGNAILLEVVRLCLLDALK